MDFSELVKHRQSNRIYQDKTVECEKLKQVLEAGRLAPSANNSQNWTFVVVENAELKARITGKQMQAFARQAPLLIVLVAEKPALISRLGSMFRKIDFSSLDIGIAAAHLCLQAADLGLGTCMIETFSEKEAKRLLNIPDDKRIALVITLGYPADNQREKKRKSFDEVVKYNKYG